MNLVGKVELLSAEAGLKSLKPGSVDLVFSDIPIGITRASFDRLPDLPRMMRLMMRAVHDRGVVALMVADLRVAAPLLAHRWYRFDMVWHKSRATGFLNARKRPLKAHEHVLVFYRRQPVYTPHFTRGHDPIAATGGGGKTANYGAYSSSPSRAGATTRHPRTVLDIPSVGTTASERVHPQQKPPEIAEFFVRSYTQPGDLVVDPYAGSGSTGVAALRNLRRFRGFDTCAEYAPRLLGPGA
jgi:site-specific DNA-methyltransferase (adenine-specific)